ncbi:type II secretion system protein GspM [Salinibius halmophilus]|uniref:type II secretion system protein GspM n=1 Tax=Salinibius halmophilus TaxID=1853216 RepID=UPI000E6755C2|nr:type II secretion system protein GspM [Salinibius halmophilus]
MKKISNHPTIVALRSKFDALPSRDQRAVSLLAIALVLGGAYFGVYYPIQQWHKEAVSDQTDTLADYQWLQDRAGRVMAIQQGNQQGQANTRDQSLSSIVSQSANSASIQLASLESLDDNRVRIRVQNGQMDAIMVMLGGLALTAGVNISQVSIDQGSEPGLVNANVDLSR